MKVLDALQAVALAVYHKPPASLAHTLLFGKPLRALEQFTQQRRIFFLRLHEARDVLFGDHQKMHRGLRRRIGKRKDFLILEQFFRRNGSGNDFTKDAIVHT
jgi:hypothetical protein